MIVKEISGVEAYKYIQPRYLTANNTDLTKILRLSQKYYFNNK